MLTNSVSDGSNPFGTRSQRQLKAVRSEEHSRKETITERELRRQNYSIKYGGQTGSQWEHEQLYRSAKGQWYVESSSQWQGSQPSAKWLTPQEAAEWLVLNDHKLPEELQHFEGEIE